MLQLIHTRHEWRRMAQVRLLPVQILAKQTYTTSTTTACGTNEDCSSETWFWPTLFMRERILSTHQDPGCVTFPAPPHKVSCSRPRACSSLRDKVGFGLTDCASLKCIQRPRSDQAFPANQVSPAFQQHLEDRKGVTITNTQCGHQLALYPILALLSLCLYVSLVQWEAHVLMVVVWVTRLNSSKSSHFTAAPTYFLPHLIFFLSTLVPMC